MLAAAYLRRAAGLGDMDAQYTLAGLYVEGVGVVADEAQAARWFGEAARNGHVGAQVEYAILLFNGRGVPKDEAVAARWFREAADADNPLAQMRLARLLRGPRRGQGRGRGGALVSDRQGPRPRRRIHGGLAERPRPADARDADGGGRRAGPLPARPEQTAGRRAAKRQARRWTIRSSSSICGRLAAPAPAGRSVIFMMRCSGGRRLCRNADSWLKRDRRPRKDREHVQVIVRDNNVDQALKALKKKMQREGIFREMKLRDHYEKPSEKRAREKAEGVRRARKLARKRAQREGLHPDEARAPTELSAVGVGASRRFAAPGRQAMRHEDARDLPWLRNRLPRRALALRWPPARRRYRDVPVAVDPGDRLGSEHRVALRGHRARAEQRRKPTTSAAPPTAAPGATSEAIADFNKAIELDPNFGRAYANRALVHRRNGDTEQAFADYNRAIQADPSYAAAYVGRGNIYRQQGQLDLALADYNAAIQLDRPTRRPSTIAASSIRRRASIRSRSRISPPRSASRRNRPSPITAAASAISRSATPGPRSTTSTRR